MGGRVCLGEKDHRGMVGERKRFNKKALTQKKEKRGGDYYWGGAFSWDD